MGAGKGAIIGAVIGGIFGGYAGAIIGAFIGGSIGGAAEDIYTTASTPPPPPPPPNSEPPAQLLAFFRLAGHLAKIDGRVSVAEANFISALIRKIGADDQALRTACKQAFDQGKTYADFDVDLYLLGAGEYLLRHQALEALCALARIDDVITDAERQFLLDAERIWNLAGSVDYFFRYSQEQQKRKKRGPTPPPQDPLAEAYSTLGCSPQDSDAAVKKAWHRKTKEFHPDLMAGRGISEETIARAEEEMKKINLAYETIMKSRQG